MVQELKTLSVIVVPMETNQDSYHFELKINGINILIFTDFIIGNETSLKQVFDENINNYWTRVFKGHSPKEPPSYRYITFIYILL